MLLAVIAFQAKLRNNPSFSKQFKGHICVLFLQDHSLVFQTEGDFFQESINYVYFSLVPTHYSIKLFEISESNFTIP